MKKLIFLLFLILGLFSCNSDNEVENNQYEFIKEYKTVVTVGGVIGITERAFKVGEVYTGTEQGSGTIIIRIAEHSELNDDCPNPWCYQELLDVSSEFLRKTD